MKTIRIEFKPKFKDEIAVVQHAIQQSQQVQLSKILTTDPPKMKSQSTEKTLKIKKVVKRSWFFGQKT